MQNKETHTRYIVLGLEPRGCRVHRWHMHQTIILRRDNFIKFRKMRKPRLLYDFKKSSMNKLIVSKLTCWSASVSRQQQLFISIFSDGTCTWSRGVGSMGFGELILWRDLKSSINLQYIYNFKFYSSVKWVPALLLDKARNLGNHPLKKSTKNKPQPYRSLSSLFSVSSSFSYSPFSLLFDFLARCLIDQCLTRGGREGGGGGGSNHNWPHLFI